MSKPHERIWAKNWHDSWGQYGHWYTYSKGGGVEYVRADRIKKLQAENKRLKALVADVIHSTGDDPEIMAASRAEWAARALEAEAKLAKAAVEFEIIRRMAIFLRKPSQTHRLVYQIEDTAVGAIAELKGEK
jgi:Txe/YoeB family toxin of Txe-Axe toxin-antitoxin module